MKKELKDRFPSWVDDPKGTYTLCLSNDLDSLLSCSLLSELKDWQINHFYDFSTLYTADYTDRRKAVGVDIALANGQGRCFDNHVTLVNANDKPNPLAANPNNALGVHSGSREAYTKKFALSTALLIYSLYDLPLPQSEQGKMLLLSIDSGYDGYYRFPKPYMAWLERLELMELADVLERHTKDDFKSLQEKYHTKSHINVQDGKLHTDIDLQSISQLINIDLSIDNRLYNFKKIKKFDAIRIDNHYYSWYNKRYNIFSLACVNMNEIKLSIVKEMTKNGTH